MLRDKPGASTGPAVILDYDALSDRRVVLLDTQAAKRPLHLVKLYDEGLAAVGTDNGLSSIDDYDTTRAWAKALHAHARQPDGLIYLSRYLGSRRSVVLFDRCRDQLEVGAITPLLAHRELPDLLDRFHIGLRRS